MGAAGWGAAPRRACAPTRRARTARGRSRPRRWRRSASASAGFPSTCRRQRAEVPDDLRVARRRLRRCADEVGVGRRRDAHLNMIGGGPGRVLDEDAVIDFLPRAAAGRRRGRADDTVGVGGSAGSTGRPGPSVTIGGAPTSGGSTDCASGNGCAHTPTHGGARHASTPSTTRSAAAPIEVYRPSANPPARDGPTAGRRPRTPIVAFPPGFVCPDFPFRPRRKHFARRRRRRFRFP